MTFTLAALLAAFTFALGFVLGVACGLSKKTVRDDDDLRVTTSSQQSDGAPTVTMTFRIPKRDADGVWNEPDLASGGVASDSARTPCTDASLNTSTNGE